MGSPWWQGLDLRVLRHVRGVLRRRDLELELVERRPAELAAFAPLSADAPAGAGLAVLAPELSAPEIALIEHMLGEAAIDVATALRDRDDAPIEAPGRRTRYAGIRAAPVMQELYSLIERVAPSDSTVMIQGENGTGKELVARAIHQQSERRGHRFVVTNCGVEQVVVERRAVRDDEAMLAPLGALDGSRARRAPCRCRSRPGSARSSRDGATRSSSEYSSCIGGARADDPGVARAPTGASLGRRRRDRAAPPRHRARPRRACARSARARAPTARARSPRAPRPSASSGDQRRERRRLGRASLDERQLEPAPAQHAAHVPQHAQIEPLPPRRPHRDAV